MKYKMELLGKFNSILFGTPDKGEYDYVEKYDENKKYTKNVFETDYGYNHRKYRWVLHAGDNKIVCARREYTDEELKKNGTLL